MLLAIVLLAAAAASPPVYRCEGFAEPLDRPGVMEVNRGRVLPLRGRLAKGDGTYAMTLRTAPVVALVHGDKNHPGDLEVRDYGQGRSFVPDREAHWKFDLGTTSLAAEGTYVVTMVSGDPAEYVVEPPCRLEFVFK